MKQQTAWRHYSDNVYNYY